MQAEGLVMDGGSQGSYGRMGEASGNGSESVVKLKVVKGPKKGAKFQLNVTRSLSQIEKSWLIGRSEKITKLSKGISIPEDAEVSGKHAKLELLSGKKLKITDLNSTNGTKVNGQLIGRSSSCDLQEGDMFTLGMTKIQFVGIQPLEGSNKVASAIVSATGSAIAEKKFGKESHVL